VNIHFVVVDTEVYKIAMANSGQNWGRLAKSVFKLEAFSPAYR
jgi:hypothetical protein